MPNFKEYAKLYDLIYGDKDYEAEAAYVIAHIKKYHPKAKSILNLGCGTGRHDLYFAKAGYSITGVDLSAEMVELAKKGAKKNKFSAEFVQGDIRQLRLNKKYDVVVSLFHVMCYQTSNSDIKAALATAKKHLNKSGLLIFDFWHGPGVLTDLPAVRSKKFNSTEIDLTRISVPTMKPGENMVEVLFELYYKKRGAKEYRFFDELHKMRYFFLPELQMLLGDNGLKDVGFYEWMTNSAPKLNTWNAILICK